MDFLLCSGPSLLQVETLGKAYPRIGIGLVGNTIPKAESFPPFPTTEKS
ncbi:hypothetical protein [Sphaerochaeta sp. PS]|nr:hypothetical protein [Sphaerochaeta sp. PS]MDT4761675.1 hypothetical protein [Sphaerochaeta sp. PS]